MASSRRHFCHDITASHLRLTRHGKLVADRARICVLKKSKHTSPCGYIIANIFDIVTRWAYQRR